MEFSSKLLDNHVALITGASSGIGKATAIALAQVGSSLALVSRNTEKLKETLEACKKVIPKESKAKILTFQLDMEDQEEMKKVVEEIDKEFNGVDILINSAGKGYMGDFMKNTLSEINETITVNLQSTLILTHLILPKIVESKKEKRAVIFISSIAGRRAFPTSSLYDSSKYALCGFAEALFGNIQDTGVKICSVNPGLVRTPMVIPNFQEDKQLPYLMEASDIANTVLFVLASPQRACPTEITILPQFKKENFEKKKD
ncbi:sdr family oxidoreductase [Anaeramoeba ignava]|uniref:Sdr family oxidoreductase n=1 Tax=Anaeramoeba ignava TaxID=1746090 RepID=A0A9Q0LJR3_ANAIG|nr:sdr family oxidoreductase [Anaeramoeba ignava]